MFVKEIEDALLRNEVDIAVHSSKDLPAILPAGLTIGAVLPREDPRDVVVLPQRQGSGIGDQGSEIASVEELIQRLSPSPKIGTSSVRRVAQLKRLIPRGRFAPIRGNLDTRLRKLDAGDYDALVLASAGLRRLGFANRISFALPVESCVPAPGQGIVAIEIRADDELMKAAVTRINDGAAAAALRAERAVVDALGGDCQTPIGALATTEGDAETLNLVATVISLDGRRSVSAEGRGPASHAPTVGAQVAARLLVDGAGDILAEVAAKNDGKTRP